MSNSRLGVFAWQADDNNGYNNAVELPESETQRHGFNIIDSPVQLSYLAPRNHDYQPPTPEEARSLRRGELPDRFKSGCISHAPNLGHVNSSDASIGIDFDDVAPDGTVLDWRCHPLDGATLHADRSSNNNLYFVHQSQDQLPVIYFRTNEGEDLPANVNHSYVPAIADFDGSLAPTPEMRPPPHAELGNPHHPLFSDIITDQVDDGRQQLPTPNRTPAQNETPQHQHQHHPLISDVDSDDFDDTRQQLPTPKRTPANNGKLENPHQHLLPDIDTDNADDDRQWVAFDVQDFEARNAPLGFLDTYTQKSNGWPMIRDKTMIPEQYITRVPYKSPCLFHDGDDDDGSGPVRLTARGVGASRASPSDEQFLAVAIFIVTATTNDSDRLDQLLALKRAQPKAAHQIAEAARNTSEALSNRLKEYPDGAPTLCNLSKIVAQIDKAQGKSNEEKAELLYAVGHDNQLAQNAIFEQIRKDRDANILKCNGLLNAVKSRFPEAARELDHHRQDTETPAIGLLPDAHAEQDDADTYDWENDRAFQEFSRKLDMHEHLRHHRLHPVSRFTDDEEKDCRHCQVKTLPEGVSKAVKVCPGNKQRAQQNWNELNERHQKALNDLSEEDLWRQLDLPQRNYEEQELIKAVEKKACEKRAREEKAADTAEERKGCASQPRRADSIVKGTVDEEADKPLPWRGTHCPICRVAFTAIQEHTVTEHWAIHRFNYVNWIRQQQAKAEAEENDGEHLPNYLSDMKVDSLLQYEMNRKSAESDLASLSNSQLNTRLHYIEKLCNVAENEVLEREEFCRLCYKTFNYGDSQLAKHYKSHRKEHVEQKAIADNALNSDLISSTSTSPTQSPTPPRQRAGQAALRRLQNKLEAERRKILDIKNNDPFIFAVNVGVLPDIAAQQMATKLSSQESSPKGKAKSKRPIAEQEDFYFQVSPRTAKLRKRDHSRHVDVQTLPETDADDDHFVAPYFFDESADFSEEATDIEPEYILDEIADSGDELDLPTSSVDEDAHNDGPGLDPEVGSVLDSSSETDSSAEEQVDEEVMQEVEGSDSDSHEEMEFGENAEPEVDSEADTETDGEGEGEEEEDDENDSDSSSDSGSEEEAVEEVEEEVEEEAEDDRDSKSDPGLSSDSEDGAEISTHSSYNKRRHVSFKEDYYGELPSPLSCSDEPSSITPPKPKRRKIQDATFRLIEGDYPSPPITPKRKSRKATPTKKTLKKVIPVKKAAVRKTNAARETLVEVPVGYKKGDSPISNRTRHKRPRKEMWKL